MKASVAVPLLLAMVGVGGKSFVGFVPRAPQYYYPLTRQGHDCVGIFAAFGCLFQTTGTVAHAGEEIFGGLINGAGQAIGGIANGTAAVISGGADGIGAGVGGAAHGVGVGLGGVASDTGHQFGEAVTAGGAAIGGVPRVAARL